MKSLLPRLNLFAFAAITALLAAGCQSEPQQSASQSAPAMAASATPAAPVAAAAPAAPVTPVAKPTPQVALPIRIAAGATDAFTDSQGHKWLPDQGFADGDTIQRPDITITNTADPEIYRAEHYGMTKFTQALPNGKYTVKLHFCETFEGISGPGDRVFSFNVAGQHDFKDFDVWKEAGGPFIAHVVTVPVDITNGQLTITFTPNIENPQINGIEILPAN